VTRIGQKVSPQEKKDHRAKTRTDAPCHVHVMFISCHVHVMFSPTSLRLLELRFDGNLEIEDEIVFDS